MDALAWEAEPPQLRSPVLVCAFAGWNDAAGSATTALTTAAESLDAEGIAQIDPEEFFDFQANRPTIRLTEGQSREIEWPGNVLLSATPAGAERDLVLLAGTEPNLRWRTFADGVADAAETLGVEMVVTLGALIADVAHTLPVPITGLASDEELVERMDLARSSYEGPTGVVGVLHDACGRRGIPSASLWAAGPAYVAPGPHPKAAPALFGRVGGGAALRRRGAQPEGGSGAVAQARGTGRGRRRGIRPRGGVRFLREPGEPRGRGQSRDRGARSAPRGRTGRPARPRGRCPLRG